MEMNETTDSMVLRARVKNAFTDAAKAFAEQPSAENWLRLEQTMWAHQGVSPGGALTAAEIQKCIETVPLPQWIPWLVQMVRNGDVDS